MNLVIIVLSIPMIYGQKTKCVEGIDCECLMTGNGLRVDCSGLSLASIPRGIPHDTNIL